MGNKKVFLIIVGITVLIGGIVYFALFAKPVSVIPKEKNVEISAKTPAHLISADQIAQMEVLMKNNGKSLEGLQAYDFAKDDVLGGTHIRFFTYVKGIRAGEVIYHFDINGKIWFLDNEEAFDPGAFANIPTDAKISESKAIEIAHSKIKKSALVATKEFWDENPDNDQKNDVVLAWKVHPADGDYTYAMINAQTGEILYYDDGIRY